MVHRTPHISAMHHDETPDLKIVAEKLEESLEVCWHCDQLRCCVILRYT
jgi:hypothetical protein